MGVTVRRLFLLVSRPAIALRAKGASETTATGVAGVSTGRAIPTLANGRASHLSPIGAWGEDRSMVPGCLARPGPVSSCGTKDRAVAALSTTTLEREVLSSATGSPAVLFAIVAVTRAPRHCCDVGLILAGTAARVLEGGSGSGVSLQTGAQLIGRYALAAEARTRPLLLVGWVEGRASGVARRWATSATTPGCGPTTIAKGREATIPTVGGRAAGGGVRVMAGVPGAVGAVPSSGPEPSTAVTVLRVWRRLSPAAGAPPEAAVTRCRHVGRPRCCATSGGVVGGITSRRPTTRGLLVPFVERGYGALVAVCRAVGLPSRGSDRGRACKAG